MSWVQSLSKRPLMLYQQIVSNTITDPLKTDRGHLLSVLSFWVALASAIYAVVSFIDNLFFKNIDIALAWEYPGILMLNVFAMALVIALVKAGQVRLAGILWVVFVMVAGIGYSYPDFGSYSSLLIAISLLIILMSGMLVGMGWGMLVTGLLSLLEIALMIAFPDVFTLRTLFWVVIINGVITYVVVQTQNTRTQLQNAMRRVSAVQDNSPDGIALINEQMEIIQCNTRFRDIFELHTVEQGISIVDLLDPHDAAPFIPTLHSSLENGEVYVIEMIMNSDHDHMVDSEVIISPISETEAAVTFHDITARKENQRMKDTILADATHELKTPITSLRLYHELIEKDPANMSTYLAKINRETDRMARLISNLLTVSRLDEGIIQPIFEQVNLDELIAGQVSDRLTLAQEKGLNMAYERPARPVEVWADQGLIDQVANILISNAIQYTQAYGEVRIGTAIREQDGTSWGVFVIKDTGPGIRHDEQHKIFRRFYRGRVGKAAEAKGTGLGLSIARQIVEKHAGRIDVHSTGIPGEGTTFTVWLPLEPEDETLPARDPELIG